MGSFLSVPPFFFFPHLTSFYYYFLHSLDVCFCFLPAFQHVHNVFISSLSLQMMGKTLVSVILFVGSEIPQNQPFVKEFFIENSHNYVVVNIHIAPHSEITVLQKNFNKIVHCNPWKFLLSHWAVVLSDESSCIYGGWFIVDKSTYQDFPVLLQISFHPHPKVFPFLSHESAKHFADNLLERKFKPVQSEELNSKLHLLNHTEIPCPVGWIVFC